MENLKNSEHEYNYNDKKRIEEFEKKYKDHIFKQVLELSSKQSTILDSVQKNGEKVGQLNTALPNVSITLNNKLQELSQIFKSSGISLFATKMEVYDIVNTSFTGDAIISDLMNYLYEATIKLHEYNKLMLDILKRKDEQIQALKNIGPIQKLFTKIKSFFEPAQAIDLSLTKEEYNSLNKLLQEYRDIGDKLWNYNLEDDLVQSIVKYIREQGYNSSGIPVLLKNYFIPDLKKLGLENLIPDLQKALNAEYKPVSINEKQGIITTTNQKAETHRNEEKISNQKDYCEDEDLSL